METILYITAAGLGAGAVAGVARGLWRRRDAQRRDTERDAYQRRRQLERQEMAQAKVAQLVDRFFPFAKTAWESAGRGDARERLRRVLAETNGITLGAADIGFDAVLPESARRQHLMCLGKSGYGKTTIALRMIRADLEAGRGLCILGSEAELFRDWLLPLIPMRRASEVIYFKPADPRCPLSWNPLDVEDGEDRARAAGELFAIFKRAIGEDSIGARADAILSSAFAVLVARTGANLQSVASLLEDEVYRSAVVAEINDPYMRDFWTKTFPEYPRSAVLPIANRLNQFLRLPQLRAAICHQVSSFSVADALARDRILLLDISGLDPQATKLIGQMLLSKFQIELMRRERVPELERRPVYLFIDELHLFADAASDGSTFRELLSRGRRFGLGLHGFTQHPNQLSRSLQRDIFGNVSSLIVLNLSGVDAAAVRRELLVPVPGDAVKPIPAEELVSLGIGEGFARLGSGACALKVKFAEPIARPDVRLGERVREISWKTYASPPVPSFPAPVAMEMRGEKKVMERLTNDGPTPGRGGAKHKLLQRLAREWGEARGFRASLEMEILAGAGRVDVALVRGDVRIAVEVRVSSSAEEVIASLTKAFAAEFTTAIVLSVENRNENEILEKLDAKDRTRVRFLDPDGLVKYLDELPAPAAAEESTVGYRLKVEHEGVSWSGLRARRRTLAQVVGTALLRQRRMS